MDTFEGMLLGLLIWVFSTILLSSTFSWWWYDLKLATKVWDRLEVFWDNGRITKEQIFSIYEVEKMCEVIK